MAIELSEGVVRCLPLFEHVGRNFKPTEAGLELYQSCRRIFETLSNLEMKLADLKGIKKMYRNH